MNTLPFYRTVESTKALATAAASWLGTKFHKGASIKGAGVDCVNLANAIYVESGFNPRFNPRDVKYSIDGGKHCRESKLAVWLSLSDRFLKLEKGEARQVGDLLVFKMRDNGVDWHCGLMVGENGFVQAMKPHGVVTSNILDPTWATKLSGVYRPVERTA